MPYYKTCRLCGATIDPGEICTDCLDKEKEPAVAATTTSSKAEQKSNQLNRSASIITESKL